MNELISFATIDTTHPLPLLVPFEAGIWRCALYATGELLDGFMHDTYNRKIIDVNNVIIDNKELKQCPELSNLRNLEWNESGWVNYGAEIYIRFYNWQPPIVFYSFKYGKLFGFTNGSPKFVDGIMCRPGLLTAPVVEQSADVFTYDKMKFNSATISIDNTNGQFDDVGDLFGNEFNVFVKEAEHAGNINENFIRLEDISPETRLVSLSNATVQEMIVLWNNNNIEEPPIDMAQFYISNVVVGLEKADFLLKDKRERLSARIPNKVFSTDDYPKIEENLIGNDMQEAYGYCFGVPGVCLDGRRVYKNDGSVADNGQDKYRFRFSSQICRVDRIQVKLTAGEIGDKTIDGWTTVYQLGMWGDKGGWRPDITQGDRGDLSNISIGEIALNYKIAKQGGKHDSGMNEVRIDGVFNNPERKNLITEFVTPLDIIIDIMWKYSDVPFRDEQYRIEEIYKELDPLDQEIGILFDKSQLVYEAIEKIQSGCVIGFQFHVHQGKFTARLDNPNRKPCNDLYQIKHQEIVNLDEVEIDWNADLYGTFTDIEYAFNYSEDSGLHLIDNDKQQKILDIHRIDKAWTVSTLLRHPKDAKHRSDLLLGDFEELCPLIKNIKLIGIKWFKLRVYDIIYIDFQIPGESVEKYPRNLVRFIDMAEKTRTVSINRKKTDEHLILISDKQIKKGKRDFAGKLRCKILRINIDTQTGITTIDVRKQKESETWVT